MKRNKLYTLLAGAMLPFLSGCGIVKCAVMATAAVLGLAGYAVYKTGEGTVTGVRKFATKTGEVASDTSKAVGTVIFFNGDFQTEHHYGIRFIWIAADTACRNAMFTEIRGSSDALSGTMTAKTRTGTLITITFKNVEPQLTKLSIRYGVTGNMAESEKINNLITNEINLMRQQSLTPPATQKQ
jgi:hypothetical protein